LTRAQPTADIETLEAVLRDASLSSMISSPFEVERAWDVCQVPDYRNISPAEHAHLISRVLAFLHSKQGVIDEDWFAKQLAFCENLEGNIDSLLQTGPIGWRPHSIGKAAPARSRIGFPTPCTKS
jgi:ATP-dependent RNA helicase SUPV3L1/SUV3